ncbi:MAG: nuclear transport factor 2 family protein [Solirubrobacteraceae bacterium]
MSPSNVELARTGWEAFARGDLDALRPLLDPEVKWHGGDPSAPYACHSSQEVLAFMARANERQSPEGRMAAELVDVADFGDRVVVVIRPGDPVRAGELRANMTTFRNGKVIEMVAFESPEEALAAASGGAR